MTRFLALCSAILFSTLSVASFGASSASAQTPAGHKLQTTPSLVLQEANKAPVDVSTDYFTRIFGDKKKWGAPSLFETTKASIFKAHDSGVWGVYQIESTDSDDRPIKYVRMFWMDDSRAETTIRASHTGSYSMFSFSPPKGHCFKEITLMPHGGVVSTTEHGRLYCGGHTLFSHKNKLFIFSGDYNLDSSARGLVGDLPKGIDDIPFTPLFWYKVEKLNFWGAYNGLGHKLGGTSDVIKPKLDFSNWLWKVYSANGDFEKQGDPLFTYKTAGFNYDFTTYGNYVITVEYDIHPPRVAPENVKPLKFEFKLKVDGSSYSATSYETCDNTGNCKPLEEESCEFYKDIAGRVQCRMRKAFDFGVFGPSLTAINQLFGSFIVKQPKCSIPIADVNLAGRTLSFSGFQSGVCARSDQLRQSFPAVPLFINFSLAVLVLLMIAGAVNRLTNPKDSNVVEAP